MSAANAVRKAGVLGPFGYGNLGDAAIQEAMIHHIRTYFPGVEVIGFSLNPEDTQLRHGIRSFPITRMSWHEADSEKSLSGRMAAWLRSRRQPFLRRLERWSLRLPLEFGMLVEAYRNLEGLDQLIISGGGQLDDYWAGGGPWSHPYTLLKFGLLAKLRGAQYLVVSVGAGPVDARLSRLFFRLALSLAQYRSFRDDYSRVYVQDVIGYRRNDPVYPDLAFSLPAACLSPRTHQAARPMVGIGPLGYFRAGCWPESDEAIYANYLDKLADFVCWLLDKQYLVTFVPGEVTYDGLAIGDLRRLLERRRIPQLNEALVESEIRTVPDLLAQLSKLDLVCASRFHTILLAQLAGTPGLALSYQAKIDELMKNTGQQEYCLPIDSFDLETLKARFLDLEANQERIRQQVAACAQAYRTALEQQYARIFSLS